MYSLSGRLNTIAFNTLIALAILSSGNFLTAYLNRESPKEISFGVVDFHTFVNDRYINEDALSFTFNLDVDLGPVFNWNTNIIFLYLSCEYTSSKSDVNMMTIWD